MTTFKNAKEHLGLIAIAAIIGWSGTQLHKLNETAQALAEAIIAMKQNDSFQDYRLDQHREQLQVNSAAISDMKVRIGRLEVRVFSAPLVQ